MGRLLAVAVLALTLGGCLDHREYVDARAAETFKRHGFKIRATEGYQTYMGVGRCYWYTLDRGDGRVWEACLARWGDDIEVWKLTCLDCPVVKTP